MCGDKFAHINKLLAPFQFTKLTFRENMKGMPEHGYQEKMDEFIKKVMR